MNPLTSYMFVRLQALFSRDEGQDLVEYALVVALIAFGAIAGMHALAVGINDALAGIVARLPYG